MSYSEGNGGMSAADVAAVLGNNRGDNGFFGGDGAWWLIVLLLFANNGWGGGFGGFGGGVPFMAANTQNDVQRGFDQSAIMSGITGISNGLAAAEVSRCNAQTNVLQAINGLAMAQQNCCCENRQATADLKYTVATEACADRAAVSDGIRDVLAANTANTQALINSTNAGFTSLMDKICQLEMDGKNQRIADLQAQLNEANRRASQNDQTAQILASQAAQTAAIEQYLRPVPMPAYLVQNPNCCTQNSGCGCGM